MILPVLLEVVRLHQTGLYYNKRYVIMPGVVTLAPGFLIFLNHGISEI